MMEDRNVATTTDDNVQLTKWYERHGMDRADEGGSEEQVSVTRKAFEEIYHDTKRNDVRSEVVMRAYAEVMQSHVKGIVDMVADAKRNGLWVEFNRNEVESFDEMIELLKEEDIISGTDDAEEAIKSAREAMQNAEESAEQARSELDDVAYSVQSAVDACSTAESYCNDARGELNGIEL